MQPYWQEEYLSHKLLTGAVVFLIVIASIVVVFSVLQSKKKRSYKGVPYDELLIDYGDAVRQSENHELPAENRLFWNGQRKLIQNELFRRSTTS